MVDQLPALPDEPERRFARSWEAELLTTARAAVLTKAWRAAERGSLAEIEAALVEVETMLRSLDRCHPGQWRRQLGRVHRDLEYRRCRLL
jgi:hypothetical protein